MNAARWLATVRGQLELLALTLGAAVVLAVLLAGQRDFFLQYVTEKYGPALASTEVAAQALEGPRPPGHVAAAEAEALYELYATAPEPRPALAKGLVAAAPDVVARRLERTFAAGDATQRARAASLAEAAPHPALADVLRRAEARATAKRDSALAARLSAAAEACSRAPAR